MHIENGDLIMGLHDLDHVLGDTRMIGGQFVSLAARDIFASHAFLEILDDSGELWMNQCETDAVAHLPIKEKLTALGVKRIVIRLDAVMTGGSGVDLSLKQ